MPGFKSLAVGDGVTFDVGPGYGIHSQQAASVRLVLRADAPLVQGAGPAHRAGH
jgi:hypothetical protein